MHRTLRFAVGWLAAATAAVGLSWGVIRDAVDPGWLGRSVPGGAAPSRPDPAGVIGAPTMAVASRDSQVGAGPAASPRVSGTPAGTPRATPVRTPPTSVPVPAAATSRGPVPPAAGGGAPTSPTTSRSTVTSTPGSTSTSTGPRPTTTTGMAATSSSASGVRSYLVSGGRVVLRLTDSGAQLVSATPDDGFRVQSWETAGWLRVDFSRDGTTSSSVIATWNGTPPQVTTVRY